MQQGDAVVWVNGIVQDADRMLVEMRRFWKGKVLDLLMVVQRSGVEGAATLAACPEQGCDPSPWLEWGSKVRWPETPAVQGQSASGTQIEECGRAVESATVAR